MGATNSCHAQWQLVAGDTASALCRLCSFSESQLAARNSPQWVHTVLFLLRLHVVHLISPYSPDIFPRQSPILQSASIYQCVGRSTAGSRHQQPRHAAHPTMSVVSSKNLYSGTSKLLGAGPLRALPDTS